MLIQILKPLNICKTKTLRTNQLCIQDNYRSLLGTVKKRFEKITTIAKKRHPTTFSYVPVAKPNQALNLISNITTSPAPSLSSTATISSQLQQLQFQQQQQQLQHFDLFLSRFNPNKWASKLLDFVIILR